MSRPYRSTHEFAGHLVHHDFATKKERAKWWAGSYFGVSGPPRLTTVTSRKPVRPGAPVCWVNVYPDGTYAVYSTKAIADQHAVETRLHCIPVYLPGEGAVTVSDMAVNSVSLAAQLRLADERASLLSLELIAERAQLADAKCERDNVRAILTDTTNERDAAKADVKLLTDSVDGLTSASEANDARYAELEERWKSAIQERDEAQRLHSKAEGEVECRNQMRAEHRVEVERLDKKLGDLHTDFDELSRDHAAAAECALVAEAERDTARAEVARLTAELASLHLGCEEFKRQRDEARSGPTRQSLEAAHANGRVLALAEVRSALGIKEPAK